MRDVICGICLGFMFVVGFSIEFSIGVPHGRHIGYAAADIDYVQGYIDATRR